MSVQVSRRKMLVAGSAALVAPMLLIGDRKGEAQTTSLSTAGRELSAISGSDPGFSLALEQLYPGLKNDPVFRNIASLALLVTHRNGPAVRALSVSWSITSTAGTFETAMYSYVAPGSASKGKSISTLVSARRAMLQAGQSRLITPFFNWTPSYYSNNRAPDWSTVLEPAEPGRYLASQLPTASQVSVSLDGAVFVDWKSIGTDKHNLSARLQTRRNAEHDEGLSIYRLLKAGASDISISDKLQSHAFAERSSKSTNLERWYEQSRRFHAQVLLRYFGSANRDKFTKAVTNLTAQKRIVITRVGA